MAQKAGSPVWQQFCQRHWEIGKEERFQVQEGLPAEFVKMIYKFKAYGHPNIFGTHKTTLEFTKDGELTLKGDCIVGVKADFDLNKIMQFIKKSTNKKITITIKPITKDKKYQKTKETASAELNPNFDSDKEFVVRKTDFVSERTFAISSNKAAFDLNRNLISFLRGNRNKISVIIENKEG